jgi:hypothetical protein
LYPCTLIPLYPKRVYTLIAPPIQPTQVEPAGEGGLYLR